MKREQIRTKSRKFFQLSLFVGTEHCSVREFCSAMYWRATNHS